MTSTTQLTQQLKTLNDSLRQTLSLIARLGKLTFHPGSESLDDNEGSARLELAQDIQDSLKQLEEDLEFLRSDLDELNTDSGIARRKGSEKEQEREGLNANLARLDQDLTQARSSLRQAQLSAKRASEAAKAQERELVFQSIVSPPTEAEEGAPRGHRRGRTQQLTKEELLLNSASDVTAGLRRTQNLLATELSRSRQAQETLEESSEGLKDLGERYDSIGDILTNSGKVLGTLVRSQKSDTWYLETALYILLGTLIWLVFRRILYGPLYQFPAFFWRWSKFATHWTILKPLYHFLLLIGVIRTEPVPLPSRADVSSSVSRPPLIIKPSASDFPNPVPQAAMDNMRQESKPVGMGGTGAKVGKEELAGKESEKIAQMVDQSREPVRRGDGTVLQERGDIPKNPKKKVLEPEPQKDEL